MESGRTVKTMDDTISRKAAREAIKSLPITLDAEAVQRCIEAISNMPSAQSEVKPIDYYDCSNAMLKMWMDNVVTDGEYNRIMDKLNAHWGKNEQV